MNGPSPESASTRSAAITAASKVLWSSELTMISTTVVTGSGSDSGTSTALITCTTPLSASMSTTVTIASLM